MTISSLNPSSPVDDVRAFDCYSLRSIAIVLSLLLLLLLPHHLLFFLLWSHVLVDGLYFCKEYMIFILKNNSPLVDSVLVWAKTL